MENSLACLLSEVLALHTILHPLDLFLLRAQVREIVELTLELDQLGTDVDRVDVHRLLLAFEDHVINGSTIVLGCPGEEVVQRL